MTYVDLPGDLAALATADLLPPLGWHLVVDLGGCDVALIDDQVTVAGWDTFPDGPPTPAVVRANITAWGTQLCEHASVFTAASAVIDVFGDDTDAGLAVRFRFDQPAGWRGITRPTRAEAELRCNPAGRSVHIDVLSRAPFNPRVVVEFSIDYFAARCGTSSYQARRAPALIDGFRHNWSEETG